MKHAQKNFLKMKNTDLNFLYEIEHDFLKNAPSIKPIDKNAMKNFARLDKIAIANAIKTAKKIDVDKIAVNDVLIIENIFDENYVKHTALVKHIIFNVANEKTIFFMTLRNNIFIVNYEYMIHHAIRKIDDKNAILFNDKFFTLNKNLIKKHLSIYPDDKKIVETVYKFDTANL